MNAIRSVLWAVLRRRPRGESGQAIVETALVAPILLLLIMAVWEFGRAWNTFQVITDATREGTRISVIANADPTMPTDTVENAIRGRLAGAALNPSLANITKTGFRQGIGVPSIVQVQYPYTFPIVGYLLSWTTGQKSITLTSTFMMRNE